MNKFGRSAFALVLLVIVSVSAFGQQQLTMEQAQQKYETMSAQFKQGKRDGAFLRSFVSLAQALKHDDVAQQAAKDYLHSLTPEDLYTKSNLQLFANVTTAPSEEWFNIFYRNPTKVDNVLGEGAAEQIVDRVIGTTEINPVAFPGGKPSATEPDWNAITASIAAKYDAASAARAVLDSRTIWYLEKQHWSEFAASALAFVHKYGAADSRLSANAACWNMFLHVSDKDQLAAAAEWLKPIAMQQPIGTNCFAPGNNTCTVDTYANLLYKLGRTEDAISWEEKAIKADTDPKDGFLKGYQDTVAKMKRGEPTWTGQQ